MTVVDEVSGFRYFDSRDLLGFVDGTANPVGLHDRILDFSTPHTGTTFLAPTATMLADLDQMED